MLKYSQTPGHSKCAAFNGAQHIFIPAKLLQNMISKRVYNFGTTDRVIRVLKRQSHEICVVHKSKSSPLLVFRLYLFCFWRLAMSPKKCFNLYIQYVPYIYITITLKPVPSCAAVSLNVYVAAPEVGLIYMYLWESTKYKKGAMGGSGIGKRVGGGRDLKSNILNHLPSIRPGVWGYRIDNKILIKVLCRADLSLSLSLSNWDREFNGATEQYRIMGI